jgi:WD domain, G-beta repeat
VTALAFSPDGQFVLAASDHGPARLWRTSNGETVHALSSHVVSVYGGLESATFSPDGKFVVTAGDDGRARIWGTSTGRELRVLSWRSRLEAPRRLRAIRRRHHRPLDAATRPWFVLGARDEIEAILVSGLAANGESSERARDIVNKLVAGGHVDYERLLQR